MSTAKFNTWQNPDGTENYKCRAWVNFNGTGTVAIRAAGNVTSITDRGTGQYTVNFTTAMSDANYGTLVTGQKNTGEDDDGYVMGGVGTGGQTSSAVQVTMQNGSSGPDDLPQVSVAVFR
jgi:hypothetical protein